MGFLTWVVLGLIVGILAKWIMPGKDGGGFFMTVILGVVGAMVGAMSAPCLGWERSPASTCRASSSPPLAP